MSTNRTNSDSQECPFCHAHIEGDAAQLEHLVKCNPGHLIEVLERRHGSQVVKW